MKRIIIFLMILALLVPVSAYSFNIKMNKSINPIKAISISDFIIPQKRDVISVSNPTKYNAEDLISFAEQGIDIHNWATWYGGRMTPFRNPDGTYYLNQEQKELIKELYSKGQTIFWIGISSDHLNFIWQENVYDETANAIKAYTNYFREAKLWKAKVGVYIPIWHDEIITNHREGMTWQEQYDLVENARAEVKSRFTWFEWFKVKWTISGQDFMVHDEQTFQLTNDYTSYWMHHTAVTQPYEAEDLVYHNVLPIMATEEWKETWKRFGKFAWTDSTLVEGNVGSRTLTELGVNIFK